MKENNEFYNKKYFEKRKYESSIHNEVYFNFLKKYIENLKNRKVLDIGCAVGLFLKNFTNNESVGIDISEYILKKAEKNTSKKILLKVDLNKEVFPTKEKFDIITMFDVIEHLDNYVFLKETLKNNLVDGGYVVVTTPNANSILRFFSRKNFTGEIDETHVNLFIPYTLDFFLKRANLKKIQIFTPYSFYNKDNFLTRKLLFGGQIFSIYRKL